MCNTRNNNFSSLTEEELETHLNINKYDDFVLTDAVRPSYDIDVKPIEGYKHTFYEEKIGLENIKIPVIAISVSKEKLFGLFLDLLSPFESQPISLVLESSHSLFTKHESQNSIFCKEDNDLVVLQHTLGEYEDYIINDGCLKVGAIAPHADVPCEVKFDDHKLIFVYGYDLMDFVKILQLHNIPLSPSMRLINEVEHCHNTSLNEMEMFESLKHDFGMTEEDRI